MRRNLANTQPRGDLKRKKLNLGLKPKQFLMARRRTYKQEQARTETRKENELRKEITR